MTDHTVKAFDRELDSVDRAIVELGGLAKSMTVDALDSLIAVDVARAHEVVMAGIRLAELRRKVESEAILAIARRSPVACDLRDVVAAIRIAGDLGRIAHHAEAIANHTIRLASAARVKRAIVGLRHMRALAVELLSDSLTAYAERDVERAWSVWERDAHLDSLEGSVFSDLLSQMIEDPRGISFCAHVISAAKNIERIGDHATNIAEAVIYLVTGAAVVDERPRGLGPADIAHEAAAGDF